VLIEIDSGLHRCGTNVDQNLVQLAQLVRKNRGLYLKGIFTHAGHVYAATTKEKVKSVAESEAEIMLQARQLLSEYGFAPDTVSVGSTPTVAISGRHDVTTEIRPGNYVFYDNIQFSLGSCTEQQWALAIMATVISQPAVDRVVIDAGSKALGLDQGAHGTSLIKGYGRLLNIDGQISRLSEEHGVIILNDELNIKPGSPVLIIPNHACAVVNLFKIYHFITQSGKIIKIAIDAGAVSQ
jgi:D-serine deaminase-like pyridoxal phosphate-dependent protein